MNEPGFRRTRVRAEPGGAIRSIAGNASYLIGARLLAKGLRALYLVVLARVLGPDLFAMASYAQFWQLLFFAVAVFGTGRLLSREIGGDSQGFSALLANSLSLRLAIALIVAPLASLAGWFMAPEPEARGIVLVFSIALIARAVASWVQQVSVAYGSSQLVLRQEAVWRPVELSLGLAMLALDMGLAAVAAAHITSWILQAATGLLLVHRRLHPVTLAWQVGHLRALLRDGASAMLSAAALALMLNGSLVFYLKLLPERGDGGQLAAVLQALAALLLVPKGLAVSTLPVLGRQLAAGSQTAGQTTMMLLRATLLASTAVALLGTALAPLVVTLLLGPDYAVAGAWLGPGLWLLLPFGAGQLLTQLLFARGDFWRNAACAWAGAAVTLSILWFLGQQLQGSSVLLAIGLGLATWCLGLAGLASARGELVLDARMALTLVVVAAGASISIVNSAA